MLNAVIVQAARELVHGVYNGITPGISKELREPNKTKIVKRIQIGTIRPIRVDHTNFFSSGY